MQIRSISTFLLCALISATAVPAREIDAALIRQEKRQTNLGTGSSGSSTSVTTLPSPTSISSDTATSSSRGSIVTESSTIVTTPDVTSATTVISSTITRTSTDASGSVTTKAEVTSSTATSEITYSYSPVVTSATSQVTLTYTSIEGGRTVTGVRTSSTVVPFTSSARVTPTALASGSGSSSGGLSDSSKKIIGGVVGGIGGALLIGALAWTAWKVRSKKKNLHDDDLYDPNANTEKLNTTTNAQQPFRTTLDQYHNPGPVNPSSNF